MTSKEAVLKALRPRRWVSTYQLEYVGGLSATRRLRELREDYVIKTRRITGSNAYEYRLVGRV